MVMSATGQDFYRKQILDGLNKLTPEHHLLFRRMYSPWELEKPLEDVVRDLPEDRLDWALKQIERTLDKIKKEQETIDG